MMVRLAIQHSHKLAFSSCNACQRHEKGKWFWRVEGVYKGQLRFTLETCVHAALCGKLQVQGCSIPQAEDDVGETQSDRLPHAGDNSCETDSRSFLFSTDQTSNFQSQLIEINDHHDQRSSQTRAATDAPAMEPAAQTPRQKEGGNQQFLCAGSKRTTGASCC
jgi:hypothetical protein